MTLNDIQNFSDDKVIAVSLGSARLLTLKENILSLKSYHDLDLNNPTNDSHGWINHGGHRIPVYSLSGNLDLKVYTPGYKTLCLILNKSDAYIGIMCEEIHALDYAIVKFEPLPKCMKINPSPIESLCIYKDEKNHSNLGMIITAESLLNYVITQSSIRLDTDVNYNRAHG